MDFTLNQQASSAIKPTFATCDPAGEELYDLENDAAEETNLVSSPEHSEILHTMRGHLQRVEKVAQAKKR